MTRCQRCGLKKELRDYFAERPNAEPLWLCESCTGEYAEDEEKEETEREEDKEDEA